MPNRIFMKRIILMAIAALFCVAAAAQDYKPLEPVDLGDNILRQTHFSKRELAKGFPTFSVSHLLATRGMNAQPADKAFDMWIEKENAEIAEGCFAKLKVGGVTHQLRVDYVAGDGKSMYINLYERHLKHIAVSGIQSISFVSNKTGKEIVNQEFNLIEQELWRRTAAELLDNLKKEGYL